MDFSSRQNMQQCDLLGLPDLNSGSSYTQQTIQNYLNSLKAVGVKGVRIDAAKHIDHNELSAIVKPTGLFAYCEVDQDNYIQGSEYYDFCKVTEFNVGRDLGGNFKSGSFKDLATFGDSSLWGLQPSANVVTFIDNHDTQRSGTPLTYKNGDIYRIATYFLLAHPYGYPKVMSSYYFNDKDQGPPSTAVHQGSNVNCEDGRNWVCEHRWKGVGEMANFRHQCDSASGQVSNFYAPSRDRVAFSRGAHGFVAINRDSNTWTEHVQTGLPAGSYTDLINKQTFTVDSSGGCQISVPAMDGFALGVWNKQSSNFLNATTLV